jgi:hypothetical protein
MGQMPGGMQQHPMVRLPSGSAALCTECVPRVWSQYCTESGRAPRHRWDSSRPRV